MQPDTTNPNTRRAAIRHIVRAAAMGGIPRAEIANAMLADRPDLCPEILEALRLAYSEQELGNNGKLLFE